MCVLWRQKVQIVNKKVYRTIVSRDSILIHPLKYNWKSNFQTASFLTDISILAKQTGKEKTPNTFLEYSLYHNNFVKTTVMETVTSVKSNNRLSGLITSTDHSEIVYNTVESRWCCQMVTVRDRRPRTVGTVTVVFYLTARFILLQF